MKAPLIAACLSAGFIYSEARSQDAAIASYRCATAALTQNDCPTAVACLERYKREAADRLSKDPKLLEQINLQIAECRGVTSPPSIRLRADAGTEGAAGAVGAGVTAGTVVPVIIVIVLILLLL